MKIVYLGMIMAVLLTCSIAAAVPAVPEPVRLTQPDGYSFQAQIKGDERLHWVETLDGYTITKSGDTWYYASLDNGMLTASGLAVGSDTPVGIAQHLKPEPISTNLATTAITPAITGESIASSHAPSTGTVRVIIIRTNFADRTIKTSHNYSYFNNLVNGATNSLKDYFDEVSYGQLNVVGTIGPVVTLPHNMAYYSNPETWTIINESMKAADPSVNFALYDAVIIYHAGQGEESSGDPNDYWSSRWYGLSMTYDGKTFTSGIVVPEEEVAPYGALGVTSHEFGHEIGLPDLYNTGTGSAVVWDWELMDHGSWNNNGNTPAHPSAWSKAKLGWLTPTPVIINSTVNVAQLESSGSAYRVRTPAMPASEYFLVENREQTGYDSAIPEAGIIIWHVDENQPNNNGAVKMLIPEDASNGAVIRLRGAAYSQNDGQTALTPTTTPDTDMNSGTPTGISFTDISAEGQSMSVNITFPAGSQPPCPNPTTINFDDLASGDYINNHYPGVVFSPGYRVWNSTGSPYYPPNSPPNVAYTHELNNSITFNSTVSYVQGYFTVVSNRITITAYDASNSPVGSVSIANTTNQLVSFNHPGIKRLVVTGTGEWYNHWALDDLSYCGEAAPCGKRVLFDNAHNNFIDYSIGSYDTLFRYLRAAGYQVDLLNGSVTPAALSGYDLFITALPQQAFTASEIAAIHSFIRGGGGALFISEHHNLVSGNMNNITTTYGITINYDAVYDPTNNDSRDYWPIIHNFASHPVTSGVTSYVEYAGASLDVAGSAVPLATGDSDSYVAAPQPVMQDSAAVVSQANPAINPNAPVTLAVSQSGAGRIGVIADANMFGDADIDNDDIANIDEFDNKQLILNLVQWLAPPCTTCGKILFDEAHGNTHLTNGSGAYAGYVNFTRELVSAGYTVDTLHSTVTPSVLSGYDLLITNTPTSGYTPAEIAAIQNYVNSSGSVLLIGEWGWGWGTTALNDIAAPFGIQANPDLVQHPKNYRISTSWPIITNVAPPIAGVSSYIEYAGASLEVRTPAWTVAWSDNNSYTSAPPAGNSMIKADISQRILSARTLNLAGTTSTGDDTASGASRSIGSSILVIATRNVSGSVERALSDLGYTYDYQFTDNFTAINYTGYNTIIVAMDGGHVSEASILALRGQLNLGKRVIMLGGSNWQSFVNGTDMYLLGVNRTVHDWTISGKPHLIVTDAANPLAAGLPSQINFTYNGAAFYMLRVEDTGIENAADNGDGEHALFHKTVGAGNLIWFTNSPYTNYWTNTTDYTYFKTILNNALNYKASHARPMIAVAAPDGRIAYVADSNLFDDDDYEPNGGASLYELNNKQVLLSLVQWLAPPCQGTPDINVNPTGYTLNLTVNSNTTRLLQISNTGTANLTYNITDTATWLNEAPTSGVVLPNGTDNITVSIIAPPLPGIFRANITITSNDPDENPVVIPVTLNATQPATRVYIDPSYQEALVGSNFTVNVSVDPRGAEVYAGEYKVYFDPSRLEAVSQSQGGFLSQDGNSSLVFVNNINNTAGFVEYGESRIGATGGVSNPGVLATITFHVRSGATEGNTTLNLSDVLLVDPLLLPISSVEEDGVVNIITNRPPVADCGADKLRCENVGAPVQFDGSASFDVDGTIVSYQWDFGDGNTGSGVAPKHTYTTYNWNGTSYTPFTVTLTVTDDRGATDTDTQLVTIWITGDANGDGRVNIIDAATVGLNWGSTDPCADLNNDGKVNIIDAATIGLNWGRTA
jgi:immune inhibitor A